MMPRILASFNNRRDQGFNTINRGFEEIYDRGFR
jgi:hypothetical protein